MKNIVTVGGGTGSYTILSGLKNIPDISLAAVINMSDDGGSAGVLRKKWGVMPGGDVRQCLVALSGKEFLNHRMAYGIWSGHKVGNVFLGILEKLTGSFSRGLKILSWILNIKGKIIPITKDDAELNISFSDGSVITGESNIDTATFPTDVEKIYFSKNVEINPIARTAILNADYIIIAPGNLFCSILPNLIVSGFRESLKKSKAKIIYVVNLVNKHGHTMGWGEKNYLEITEKYLGRPVDFILINDEEFSAEQIEQYSKDEEPEKIFLKKDLVEDTRVKRCVLLSDKIFVQEKIDTVKRSLIRHDSEKLAECIMKTI